MLSCSACHELWQVAAVFVDVITDDRTTHTYAQRLPHSFTPRSYVIGRYAADCLMWIAQIRGQGLRKRKIMQNYTRFRNHFDE